MDLDLIAEIYQFFLGVPVGTIYERTENGSLFRLIKGDGELSIYVLREGQTLYEKTICYDYMPLRAVLGRILRKDWQAVFDALGQYGVVSNSDVYNYTIEHYAEYGLNLDSREDMLKLNNVMEANGESLEDLGDYTSIAFDFQCRDRADAAEWFLETNAFWNGWNEFAEWSLDSENDIDSARESILSSILYGNLVMTTDGIVDVGIV